MSNEQSALALAMSNALHNASATESPEWLSALRIELARPVYDGLDNPEATHVLNALYEALKFLIEEG